jgi:hypothetical protein
MTSIFRAAFPRQFSKEDHRKAMIPHMRKIVACHGLALGDYSLSRGRYTTAEDMRVLHEKSSRIARGLRWRYDTVNELKRTYYSVVDRLKK